jgi:adenine-specific DNA-methyltransferase
LSAIHDLIAQISDTRLRERLTVEWARASQDKKFGLVFESHLPELLPLYKAKPRRGDLVCRRQGPLKEVWQVRTVRDGVATCLKPQDETNPAESIEAVSAPVTFGVDELLVVRQFGEPIFPALVPVDVVANGPADAPWHTLIEADNYHALQLLDYLYAGKVDCIYIDPPYNTGARDWKYNNDYVDGNDGWRHSKWLAFMEKRLKLSKRLLKPDTGVLIVTIDEHEVHHLGMLLEQEFPEAYRQLITIVITARGVAKQGLARVEEYALYAYLGTASASSTTDDFLTNDHSDSKKSPWASLLRRGTNAAPFNRPGLVYPIHLDPKTGKIVGVGETLDDKVKRGELTKQELNSINPKRSKSVAWPIRSDGALGTWQVSPSRLLHLKEKGFVKTGRFDADRISWSVNYLKRGPISEIERGELVVTGYEWEGGPAILEYAEQVLASRRAKTVWHRTLHDAGTYGSGQIRAILGNRAFEFPKSIYAVKDTLSTIVGTMKNALVVDFFAGSGTTLNAINLMNAIDDGRRQCILVTNNEVSAEEGDDLRARDLQPGDKEWESQGICRSVTWPRSKFTILGRRDDGTPLPGDYLTGNFLEKEKARNFTQIGFVDPLTLDTSAKKKQVLALIDGLPQTLVKDPCPYIVSEDHEASILFDIGAADEWLNALVEQEHITDIYIFTQTKRVFDGLKVKVEDILGPLLLPEEEKRPLSAGFAANLAYFKLDFLDHDRVALKRAFREILPLLWLKAGAVGARPELPARAPEPAVFAPEGSNFAVLLEEGRLTKLLQTLKQRTRLSHVFIVTDADESFKAMAAEVVGEIGAKNPDLQIVQLYRDYLVNFMINKRHESEPGSNASGATGSRA